MAISYVAASNTTYASRTNTTGTAPTGSASGDIVIATVVTGAVEAPDASPAGSGWTQIGSTIDHTVSGFNLEIRDYWGIVGTVSSYVFNHSSCSSQVSVRAYRGVDNTTPLDATSTTGTGTGATTTWPTITTATNGAWIECNGCDWADTANNLTPPGGMTEALDVTLTYAAYETRATAGATGTRTHTNNSNHPTLSGWTARTIALRPASAGAYTLDADAGSYSITGTTADLLHGYIVDADAGSYSISGQDAGLSRGMPLDAVAGSYAVSGTVADLLHGYLIDADAGSYAVTGTTADLLVGYLLNADAGSYAITGSDAGFVYTFVVDADAGSYAVTGSDAGLSRGMPLDALAGSYSVSGSDADLLHGYLLDAAAGSYLVGGQDADLLWGYVLDAEAGSYAVVGADAALEYVQLGAYLLSADEGSYTVAGTDADLLWGYLLDAEAGAYAITGSDADLTYLAGYLLDADSGSYAVAGDDADLLLGYLIEAEPGSYEVTGTDAGLIYSADVVPAPVGVGRPKKKKGKDPARKRWEEKEAARLEALDPVFPPIAEIVEAKPKRKPRVIRLVPPEPEFDQIEADNELLRLLAEMMF